MRPFDEINRLERAEWLDRPAAAARTVVQRVLRHQGVKDALHGVWLGHPLHPGAAQFALGSFTSAALLDALGDHTVGQHPADRGGVGDDAADRGQRLGGLRGGARGPAARRPRARGDQRDGRRALRGGVGREGAGRQRTVRVGGGRGRRGRRGRARWPSGLPAGVGRQPRRGHHAHRPRRMAAAGHDRRAARGRAGAAPRGPGGRRRGPQGRGRDRAGRPLSAPVGAAVGRRARRNRRGSPARLSLARFAVPARRRMRRARARHGVGAAVRDPNRGAERGDAGRADPGGRGDARSALPGSAARPGRRERRRA